MKHAICVTEKHIRCGTPGECHICPIALAIQEAIPGARVEVFGHVAFVNRKPLNLPPSCVRFVAKFDKYLAGEPFAFVLDTDDVAKDWKWY